MLRAILQTLRGLSSSTPQASPRAQAAIALRAGSSARGSLQWIPAGQPISIAGRSIGGGMVYVGRGAPTASGYGIEPALVDPSLTVDWNRPAWAGEGMTYWPSYSGISPACRAAYLSWLASGRSRPDTYIGYVFLYFYGLERRVLLDAKLARDHPDLAVIAGEVERLLAAYGDNNSFRAYASSFVDLLRLVSAANGPLVPPDSASIRQTREVPLGVRVALGRYAAAGQAIPAAWALALVRTHPDSRLRTPATRCVREFDDLFCSRYRARYGAGMVVRPPKAIVDMSYHPASAGFAGVRQVRLADVPDVTQIKGPINKLKELSSECTDALDAYSRYLGRTSDGARTPTAAGLLPPELLEEHGGEAVAALRRWATGLASDDNHAVTTIDEIVAHWSPGREEKLRKADAVSLAGMLAKLGVGMEPDVRFGGATPKPGSAAVLYSLPSGSTDAPSPQYAAAAVFVDLCAVVASADGSVTEAERRHLAEHLKEVLGLDPAECARLEAHLTWLVAVEKGFVGLKRQVDGLDTDRKVEVGGFLVDVAAIDGVVTPEEIRTLTKLFKLLGLDEAEVYRRVLSLGTDDSGPVTVRSADDSDIRWAIPPPEERVAVRLDPARVQARLADTVTVTALLADIFAEDTAESGEAGPPALAATGGVEDIQGLDEMHSTLAANLCRRQTWNRAVVLTRSR